MSEEFISKTEVLKIIQGDDEEAKIQLIIQAHELPHFVIKALESDESETVREILAARMFCEAQDNGPSEEDNNA